MKHLEKIVEALKSLTDRYGITISEVPERLREKILTITGNECASELDLLLLPLLNNHLRPIRVRAGNRVTEKVVAEAIQSISDLEGFNPELAKKVVAIWMGIFQVRAVKSLIETEHFDEFDRLSKQLEIKDDIRLTTDESVERVFNPFDTDVPVSEPQVADYDGNFGDLSFEKVADFKISDAENQVTQDIESFDSQPHRDSGRNQPLKNDDRKDKSAKKKPRNAPVPVVEPEPQSQNLTASKHTIDDAFKQLRNNNFEAASKIMMELARNGNSKAQFHLGEFYLMGTGVELSEDKAKYWFRKAAASGSFPAKQKLESLESNDGSSGCVGCFFVVIIVGGALKLLTVLAGL